MYIEAHSLAKPALTSVLGSTLIPNPLSMHRLSFDRRAVSGREAQGRVDEKGRDARYVGEHERKNVECDLRRQQRVDEVRSGVLNVGRRIHFSNNCVY